MTKQEAVERIRNHIQELKAECEACPSYADDINEDIEAFEMALRIMVGGGGLGAIKI